MSPIVSRGWAWSWMMVLEWVGGWVGGVQVSRGEEGGLNALLDSMGGWVGGWVDFLPVGALEAEEGVWVDLGLL